LGLVSNSYQPSAISGQEKLLTAKFAKVAKTSYFLMAMADG
jgi:hypothetical protein